MYEFYGSYFEKDDYEKVQELIKDSPLSATVIAAAYSREKTLSKNMGRWFLSCTMEECKSLNHAILLMAELFGEGHARDLEEPTVRMITDEVLSQKGAEVPNAASNRKKLFQHIDTCSDSEFDRMLPFLAKIAVVASLPEEITITTLVRARQRMKDDRFFFILLNAAIATGMAENLMAEAMAKEVMAQIDEAIAEFQKEATARFQEESAKAHEEPESSECPTPGAAPSTDWWAKQPRRKHDRRKR